MRKEIEVLQNEILDYKDTNYHMKTQIGELKRNFNEIRNGNIEKLEQICEKRRLEIEEL